MAETFKIDKKNFLLALFSRVGENGLSPVKLQKSVFIIQEAFKDSLSENYNFQPYNYGPFDVDIYHDEEQLIVDSLLEKVENKKGWLICKPTLKGKKAGKNIYDTLPKDFREYIDKVVSWITPLSFQQIVATIYKHYPHYKINSVFQE